MPELPEVETIKTALSRSVGSCNIADVIINNNKLREKIPDDLRQKVVGAKITAYRRIAKYIIMDLDNGLSLIWHMGMSGKIKITDTKPTPPQKHDHVILETSNGFITFNDPRRFGLLTYTETSKLKEHPLLCRLGPEPLEKTFSTDYLFERLQCKKVPIKTALLDQEIVSGIGNIYASEALFEAGISPLRPADKLKRRECSALIKSIRDVLLKAIAAGGSTLKDYQKPDGNLGYFQNMHCVYNKTGQKCPCCTCDINRTGGIQKVVLAGRSTYFCPVKQK